MNVIDYRVDAEGIATIVFDMCERPMNVLNRASIAQFEENVERAVQNPQVRGVIVTATRSDFVVGADLDELRDVQSEEQAMAAAGQLARLLRRMETSGKPFVAAINGTALGGGLEICLACHHRIAADVPKAKFGFPEVTLGILPGAGGTQRLPRLIGIVKALPFLLEGRQIDVDAAKAAGLVDEVVPPSELQASAKQWLLGAHPEAAVQSWDRAGYAVASGNGLDDAVCQAVEAARTRIRAPRLHPAPKEILDCVQQGCSVSIDAGLSLELQALGRLAVSSTAKNLIRTTFYAIKETNALVGRPQGHDRRIFRKLGVLGGGMMGAGIAHVGAVAGMAVVLIDTSAELAEAGKARAVAPLAKQVAAGRMSAQEMAVVVGRITATDDFSQLSDVDMVIEAVFEDRAIKADVTRRAEAVLPVDAVYASNTTTLPISGLAKASSRPTQFVGLHFFSPVERMPLVEVIRGHETSDQTIAQAMDFVKQLRKTPILVEDGRGFYTSRVFGTYIHEGMALLAEGVDPACIERAGVDAGMPVGPLALSDELSIGLLNKIMRQTQEDLGDDYVEQPDDAVLITMSETLGRQGRKNGAGFYDYQSTGAKTLWPGLSDHFPLSVTQLSDEEVRQRLMFIQSIEAARCLEEGIVGMRDADVGSILGWSFPAALGGVVGQIDTVGLKQFVSTCDEFERRVGPRYASPRLLRDRLAAGEPLRVVSEVQHNETQQEAS